MIKTVVVDDESGVRSVIKSLLKDCCPDIDIVGEAFSVASAIEVIENHQPDLVLLDIQMPGGNGFKVLEHFTEIYFKVIFITAFDEFAIKAIKFNAMDYLLKPVNSGELEEAIQKVRNSGDDASNIRNLLQDLNSSLGISKIAIPSTGKITYIEIDQIIRMQAEGSYTEIFLGNGSKLLSSKPIKEFEELLNERNFFRVHRSHLINLKMVSEFSSRDKEHAIMLDGSRVEVSRNHRNDFKKAMENI